MKFTLKLLILIAAIIIITITSITSFIYFLNKQELENNAKNSIYFFATENWQGEL